MKRHKRRNILFLIIIYLFHFQEKLVKLKSVESAASADDESETSMEEEKEEEEFHPTTWQILKLCEPEKWLMVAGVFAAICVGASFPLFAVLFGETYGVCSIIERS